MIHGVGVPTQDNDPAAFPLAGVPFLTWDGRDYDQADHWPMVYRNDPPAPALDDGRPLLLFNEPEDSRQADLYPSQAAHIAMGYQDWRGPLYVGGTVWHDAGWIWFNDFLNWYDGRIDAISLHAFPFIAAEIPQYAERWRRLADDLQCDIVVSEWAWPDSCRMMRDFAADIERLLAPSHMFCFSWRYHGWPAADLVDAAGEYTRIGDCWQTLAGAENHEVYLPSIIAT